MLSVQTFLPIAFETGNKCFICSQVNTPVNTTAKNKDFAVKIKYMFILQVFRHTLF